MLPRNLTERVAVVRHEDALHQRPGGEDLGLVHE
jgi:hypothetical protein